MTPVEFANKYLSPPERVRYIHNVVKGKWFGRHESRTMKACYFINDGFDWESSPEGYSYWHKLQFKVRKRKVGWFNDSTRIRR